MALDFKSSSCSSVEAPSGASVPMTLDYDTVGVFNETLDAELTKFVARVGESAAFCGDPRCSSRLLETGLASAKPVICRKTRERGLHGDRAAGRRRADPLVGSHFQRFVSVREELAALRRDNPAFSPAISCRRQPGAATTRSATPVECGSRTSAPRRPSTLANTGYALMLRLLAYSYAVPRPSPEKTLAVDLSLALMRAVTLSASTPRACRRDRRIPTATRACRSRACATPRRSPRVRAPVGFLRAAERDGSRRSRPRHGRRTASGGRTPDHHRAARQSRARVCERNGAKDARRSSAGTATPAASAAPATATSASAPASAAPERTVENGIERVEGKKLTLVYEGKRCIHSRNCVTWGPNVFLANVEGPWIHRPTSARRARFATSAKTAGRTRGRLPSTSSPCAKRGRTQFAPSSCSTACRPTPEQRCVVVGRPRTSHFATALTRRSAFPRAGSPKAGATDMLAVRNGPLSIEPLTDGPLQVRGNLEITTGTGRIVARVTQAKLCRCGGSANKPFCDGTHARIGFRST